MSYITSRDFYTTEKERVDRHATEQKRIDKEKFIKFILKDIYRKGNQTASKRQHLTGDRIQLTVIGNRITNDFIYCMNLVKQLHKYRQRKFKAPKIRGVTSLEWPIVLRNLKLQFGGNAHCLQSEVAILIDDKFFGGINELKEFAESRYHYDLRIDFQKERIQQFTDYINNHDRPFVYMHICINGDPIGTLIFMLYKDIVPQTCENFIRLCEATKGGYSGTPIHRIVKDCWVQCGGYNLKRNDDLMCENFRIPHDRRGVLGMANNGRDNDCSTQFFILLQPAPWMDQKYVAFGQLVEGEGTLRKLENVPTWYEAPNDDIIIFKTGILSCRSTIMPINKNTKEYLSGHVEDLNAIGQIFYEELLVKLFLAIDKRMNDNKLASENLNDVRRTKSFMVTIENTDKTLLDVDNADVISNASQSDESVEGNQYELEEYVDSSLTEGKLSTDRIPSKQFYIPLTDVPDPEETSSKFNLQKLLKGEYCLQNDLSERNESRKAEHHIPEDICYAMFDDHRETDNEDEYFLSINDEEKIKEYIKKKVDTVSFAGQVIKRIADMGKTREPLGDLKRKNVKMGHISDEELRQIRMTRKCKAGSEIIKESTSSQSSQSSIPQDCREKHDSSSVTKFDVEAKHSESNDRRNSPELPNYCATNDVKDEKFFILPKKTSFKTVYSKSCVTSESQFKKNTRSKRPSMTVDEYQKKNLLYAAVLNKAKPVKQYNTDTAQQYAIQYATDIVPSLEDMKRFRRPFVYHALSLKDVVFNPEFPIKEKPICKHPWEHRIKGKFTSLYKYSHNSVENPLYPSHKTDFVGTKPIKFTVIGNRVTKPFIYCMHLVRGLHKYRKKEFDSPIVRGVTSVEWPKVWNDLKLHFGTEVYCIKSQVAVLLNNKFLGGEEELKTLVETKYVYYYPECLDYHKEGIEQFSNYVKSTGRPCAYLHIAIDDEPIGALIFMLYSDLVPVTCRNFMKLCELSKGGYVGTPVHRIVQDSWIQCGGFGLKNPNAIDCENYMVPHDRRGVLGMANDGRNNDCSTQFFVLLKPAVWMKHKYVAFGQLIEGEGTLTKIEAVPTWYESPTSRITIYKAGVFNTECHWRAINKSATEYLHGHIEDLVQIGKLFYQALLERVYEAIERLEAEEEAKEEEKVKRPPRRHKRKKDDMENMIKDKSSRFTTPATSTMNNDFDVDEFSYEYAEEAEPEQVPASVRQFTPEPSIVAEEPYYLPLTDVPYPGEVESAFNLQRLLRGDYCLETDLEMNRQKRLQTSQQKKRAFILPESLIDALFECIENKENNDEFDYNELDSDDEKDINEYIKTNIDKTSFAGPTIKKISNLIDKFKIFRNEDELKRKKVYNDEDLRLLRIAAKSVHTLHRKTVSISKDTAIASHTRIHRRLTGYVRWEDVESIEQVRQKFLSKEDERENESLSVMSFDTPRRDRVMTRQLSSYVHATQGDTRRSVLLRLYEDVSSGDLRSTLKHHGEKVETNEVSNFAFLMPTDRDLLDREDATNKLLLSRRPKENVPLEDSPQFQLPGHRLSRKVSSDYVNALLHSGENTKSSIRTVEYARHRPSISVNEYKLRNQKYQEEHQPPAKEGLEKEHK